MTKTVIIDSKTNFLVSRILKCNKASHDSYAKNITCEMDTDTPKFRFQVNQVSTSFDPYIYTAEKNLQLYSTGVTATSDGSGDNTLMI